MMKKQTKRSTNRDAAVKASIARHKRYADIEHILSTMDRDADPTLVCELEIEMAGLADAIANEVF